MNLLGAKDQIVGAEHWTRLHVRGRPQKMPTIPAGYEIVCGLDFGDGDSEEIFECGTLEHMKALYDKYFPVRGVTISWYQKPAPSKLEAAS